MAGGGLVERVAAGGLLAAGRPVVVMLSGGRDSVCLLDVAVTLCHPAPVLALHCNYRLRDGSDGDEEHCAALCSQLGVGLEVCRPALGAGNLQAQARAARYAAAWEIAGTWRAGTAGGDLADAASASDVATGHTASDQAETVLYRLAASPGRRALLGIAPRRDRLVRPLLSVSREETAAHCRARGLRWREDPSNEDPRFARVRARRGLVPALRELHPAAEENLARTVAELRAEAEALDELVASLVDGASGVDLARLGALPRALARLMVRRLAEDTLGQPAPDAAGRLDEVLALGGSGARGEIHLARGLRAVVGGGWLRYEVVAVGGVKPVEDPTDSDQRPAPGAAEEPG